jgi:hypothetical protein
MSREINQQENLLIERSSKSKKSIITRDLHADFGGIFNCGLGANSR